MPAPTPAEQPKPYIEQLLDIARGFVVDKERKEAAGNDWTEEDSATSEARTYAQLDESVTAETAKLQYEEAVREFESTVFLSDAQRKLYDDYKRALLMTDAMAMASRDHTYTALATTFTNQPDRTVLSRMDAAFNEYDLQRRKNQHTLSLHDEGTVILLTSEIPAGGEKYALSFLPLLHAAIKQLKWSDDDKSSITINPTDKRYEIRNLKDTHVTWSPDDLVASLEGARELLASASNWKKILVGNRIRYRLKPEAEGTIIVDLARLAVSGNKALEEGLIEEFLVDGRPATLVSKNRKGHLLELLPETAEEVFRMLGVNKHLIQDPPERGGGRGGGGRSGRG